MMESIETLRGASHLDDDKWTLETGEVVSVCGSKLSDPNAVNWGEQWRKIADEIEAEIADKYIRLPVDADGVPIHVGDVMEFCENRNQGIVKALNEHMVIAVHVGDDYKNYAKYGLLWDADSCRHAKPDKLSELLCDMIHEYGCTDALTETVAGKYAERIRELMKEGGDD